MLCVTVVNQLLEPSMLALLGTECRFIKPTFEGDTITAHIEVIEARPSSRPDRGIVKFRRDAVTQRDEIVAECIVSMLFKRREAA